MPEILSNNYVQASGYACRGWSKLVLSGDVAGAISDAIQALKTAGFDKTADDIHNGVVRALASPSQPGPPPL